MTRDELPWPKSIARLTLEQCKAIYASQTVEEEVLINGPPWEVGPCRRLCRWESERCAAITCGCTDRHVRRLVGRGLPSRGHHGTRRYPYPHVEIWRDEYQRRRHEDGRVPEYLDMEDAFEEYNRRQAEEDAALAERARRDPALRARMEETAREGAAETLALRRRLKRRKKRRRNR